MSMEDFSKAWETHQQGLQCKKAIAFDKDTNSNSPFLGTDQDHPLLESGLPMTNLGDVCECYYGFQTEAGKSADPRTLRLLEFFRELYHRRHETFKKMVPAGLQEELVELSKRIGVLLLQLKSNREVRTMQRSLSVGSRRRTREHGSEFTPGRFKVRTVNLGSGGSAGGGGGGGGDIQKNGQSRQGETNAAESK